MVKSVNNENKISIDLLLGVCIKDVRGTVLSQNEICKKICGSRVGEICKDGCMKNHSTQIEDASVVDSPKTIHNVHGGAEPYDAVLINIDTNIITLLFSRKLQIEKEMLMFKKRGLSKMEQSVVLLLLDGLSNKQMAESLFVSVATIKTHINNLYKKLPSSLKHKIISLRK